MNINKQTTVKQPVILVYVETLNIHVLLCNNISYVPDKSETVGAVKFYIRERVVNIIVPNYARNLLATRSKPFLRIRTLLSVDIKQTVIADIRKSLVARNGTATRALNLARC